MNSSKLATHLCLRQKAVILELECTSELPGKQAPMPEGLNIGRFGEGIFILKHPGNSGAGCNRT